MEYEIPMLIYGVCRVRRDAYQDADDLSYLRCMMDPSVRKRFFGDAIEEVEKMMKSVVEALDRLYTELIDIQLSEGENE